jgi:type IV secretion system protein VirB4
MFPIKQFRDKAKGLPDLLNWAALIDDGIVLGKDGSLLAGYFYAGPDMGSCTGAELNYLTARVNVALARLGSGWVSWHEAARIESVGYPAPELSAFPDKISRLIDEERRQSFEAEAEHFQSEYALVLQYTPPLRSRSRIADMVYDDEAAESASSAERILAGFKKALSDIEDTLGDVVRMRRMGGFLFRDDYGRDHLRDELLNFLVFCMSGERVSLNVPSHGMYLDAMLGAGELWAGDTPKLGDQFICTVGIEGFPGESAPGLLDMLNRLPIAYRWSTRMIYLDQHEALNEIKKYRRKWRQKVRGFWSQIFRTQGGVVNEDALLMSQQAEAAHTEASSALVTFGYYTPVIVLRGSEREVLTENARMVVREVQRAGFQCRIETVNTMEAWLGSLPGHPLPNIRRPLVHTLNLADLLPLSNVWVGRDTNPNPLFPEGSPPLLYAATTGATPFRLNIHVGDVGHTLIFGPTGAGKSVLLATLALQFLRYEAATICCFDKGRSLWAVAKACGGRHYDIGAEAQGPAFCPLSILEGEGDLAWAEEWIATCFELQVGRSPTPRQREAIHRGMQLLRDAPASARSLTEFCASVQDKDVRDALAHYTIDGAMGHLLDSAEDRLEDVHLAVFEVEELMAMGERNALPVLLYLFRRFERSLKGQPALLLLDEAWLMLGHAVFREKIREWLKVLRKANCAVCIATQSLSDASRSGILDVLMEQCPTKIYLPNLEADKGGSSGVLGPRDLYTMLGLNDREVEMIKSAIYKRQYYYTSPEGRRLFELGLGPVSLSFVAVSDKETLNEMRWLETTYGSDWPFIWLQKKGVKNVPVLA